MVRNVPDQARPGSPIKENAMQLFSPDILSDVHGLSMALSIAGLVIGLLVWLTGWWYHRFWVVLVTTLLAGIFGLWSSPGHRIQPLVVGLLLAVAAGVLALALVRLVAFAAGGAAAWFAVHALAPASWDDPMLCLLCGGLASLFLFRLWMMALTSFVGALLMSYSALCLVDRLGKVDAANLCERRGALLSWGCVGLTVLGLGLQFFIDRWHHKRKAGKRKKPANRPEENSEQFYSGWNWWLAGKGGRTG